MVYVNFYVRNSNRGKARKGEVGGFPRVIKRSIIFWCRSRVKRKKAMLLEQRFDQLTTIIFFFYFYFLETNDSYCCIFDTPLFNFFYIQKLNLHITTETVAVGYFSVLYS